MQSKALNKNNEINSFYLKLKHYNVQLFMLQQSFINGGIMNAGLTCSTLEV